MKQLKKDLLAIFEKVPNKNEILDKIVKSKEIYPFSQEEQMISFLLSNHYLNYEEHENLYNKYLERNKYLDLFDMAPRTFGETWGEKHILSLFPQFEKATKENMRNLYPNFDGEFDLWYDGIRIEVKACRANNSNGGGGLSGRAYMHQEANLSGFKYHYQQLKPSCCDVFIWIGTCRDELIYWVLTSEELKNTGKLGSQHRNENTGMDGIDVFEGQVFMTEDELKPFLVDEKNVFNVVISKGRK